MSSSVIVSSTIIRFMEPKTSVLYNENFSTGNEDEKLPLIQVGYHRWRSTITQRRFGQRFVKVLKPLFSFGVYHRTFNEFEITDINDNIEREYKLKMNSTDNNDNRKKDIMRDHPFRALMENDFPYHYQKANNFRNKKRDNMIKKLKKDARSQEELDVILKQEQIERNRRTKRVDDLYERKRPSAQTEFTNPIISEVEEREMIKDGNIGYDREYFIEMNDDDKIGFLNMLFQSENKMENLYIIHLNFLISIPGSEFIGNLYRYLDRYTKVKYNFDIATTLSGLLLLGEFEDIKRIKDGDELLLLLNETSHKFELYYKSNHVRIGYGRMERDSKNKFDIDNKKEFKLLLSIQSDLLIECFKYIFIYGNSGITNFTEPSTIETYNFDDEQY